MYVVSDTLHVNERSEIRFLKNVFLYRKIAEKSFFCHLQSFVMYFWAIIFNVLNGLLSKENCIKTQIYFLQMAEKWFVRNFSVRKHIFLHILENGQKLSFFWIDVFYFEELIDVSYILTF